MSREVVKRQGVDWGRNSKKLALGKTSISSNNTGITSVRSGSF
ncbi:MAG: hypothetical protein ABEK59_07890 [Halobacteria archaeon]